MKIREYLSSPKSLFVLLPIVFLSTVTGIVLGSGFTSNDSEYYRALSEGILRGIYSPFYDFPVYTPDTTRTPGYPIFLALSKLLTGSKMGAFYFQYIFHVLSILLCVRIIKRISGSQLAVSLFLILLSINLQLPYFAGIIITETPMIFLVTLFTDVFLRKNNEQKRYALLGVIAAAMFYIRPTFLLFPLLLSFTLWYLRIKKRSSAITPGYSSLFLLLAVQFILIAPFGLWNYTTHGRFMLTPLEGGAGIMHLGYWQYKLPGYEDPHYWTNYMGDDIVKFIDGPEEFARNLDAYNDEWNSIDSIAAQYYTPEDAIRDSLMSSRNLTIYRKYSAGYTLARENALRHYYLKNVADNPWYYLKTRLLHLPRLWMTGLNESSLKSAGNYKEFVKAIYPTLITMLTFLFLFPASILLYFKRKPGVSEQLALIVMVIAFYITMIHLPFATQSRYTIPVHLPVLIFIAVVFARVFQSEKIRK